MASSHWMSRLVLKQTASIAQGLYLFISLSLSLSIYLFI